MVCECADVMEVRQEEALEMEVSVVYISYSKVFLFQGFCESILSSDFFCNLSNLRESPRRVCYSLSW